MNNFGWIDILVQSLCFKLIQLYISLITLYFLQNQGYFSTLCRSSLCDQVRHLYYRIRSNGPLAYNSISTSTTNSVHQVGFLFCVLVEDLDPAMQWPQMMESFDERQAHCPTWVASPNPWHWVPHSFLHRKLCLYDYLSSNDLVMLWLQTRECISSSWMHLMLRFMYFQHTNFCFYGV